jgi:hypothetical protein
MRAQIDENAAMAVRIRTALLERIMGEIAEGQVPDLSGEVLKLLKDTEDRGLGAPKQTLAGDAENPIGVSLGERVIVDTKATD